GKIAGAPIPCAAERVEVREEAEDAAALAAREAEVGRRRTPPRSDDQRLLGRVLHAVAAGHPQRNTVVSRRRRDRQTERRRPVAGTQRSIGAVRAVALDREVELPAPR